MNTAPRIAIVEDDPDLLQNTEDYLRACGYPVWGVGSAEAFYKRFSIEPVDVVVLDIGLPGEDGLSVVRHLQDLSGLAVIILSARDAPEDRLEGLRAGADRYLVKPVSLPELGANIEAVTRRQPASSSIGPETVSGTGGFWALSLQNWVLIAPDGAQIGLTSREFSLLELLCQSQGQVVSKRDIADHIYGARVLNGSERTNVLLARLRKKAEHTLHQELPIRTVHQVGYAFTAPFVPRA